MRLDAKGEALVCFMKERLAKRYSWDLQQTGSQAPAWAKQMSGCAVSVRCLPEEPGHHEGCVSSG